MKEDLPRREDLSGLKSEYQLSKTLPHVLRLLDSIDKRLAALLERGRPAGLETKVGP